MFNFIIYMTQELLNYFNGDELAASVWLGKYAQADEKTPDDMHRRLAKEFYRIEEKYQNEEPVTTDIPTRTKLSTYGRFRPDLTEQEIFNFFEGFKFIIPQGSVMANLGSPEITSLSNCFVIGQPEDSYGSILLKDQEQIQLMKRRGGVGIDISTLRPAGTSVTNSAKTSTGAVSFMHRYSNSTKEVAQGGRRGALMISMHVNHPDIADFIKVKRDTTSVTGANISIKLPDKFMEAVSNDDDYILTFPTDRFINPDRVQTLPYGELIKLEDGLLVKKIRAKEYWKEIITSARDYAEPGLMFWDTMVEYSPDGVYPQYKQVTTNPCSEIAMQPYDACRLIAVNLFNFVDNPFTANATFDFKKFYRVNYEAMRLSDDLVDLELEAIDRILEKIAKDPESAEAKSVEMELWLKVKRTASASRRTGLGLTALGDTLAALGYKYDSPEALDVVEDILYEKMLSELDCTTDLAILRGTFSGWNPEIEFPNQEPANRFYTFLQENYQEQVQRMNLYGRRNVSWSTIAPTGTVSLLSQTTSGLEPLFKPYYIRRKKINTADQSITPDFIDESGDGWLEYPVLHPKFKDWLTIQHNITDVDSLSEHQLEKFFNKSPWAGATANDINWQQRVKIQGILQKYISHSISSTINLPSDIPAEEVSDIYLNSWRNGLKGITVYREGSRAGVLVSKPTKQSATQLQERPDTIKCTIQRFRNGKKDWVAFVGLIDNKPYEIFTGPRDLEVFPVPINITEGEILRVRKEGEQTRYDFRYVDFYGYTNTIGGLSRIFDQEYWNYARFVSSLLRNNIEIVQIVNIVEGLSFPDESLNSWKAGVIRSLKIYIPDGTKVKEHCENCGGENMVYENGCKICKDCGHSTCS